MANLLIVDDEPGMRQLLSHVFGRAGHAVRTAENGAKALELLRHSPEMLDGHKLEEELPEEPLVAMADVEGVRQVFWNLARNALKAMPDGGTLRAEMRRTAPGSVRITFVDTGRGMSPAQVERLFEPFSSSTTGGTGLGLSIVYQIIRDHGGTINVRSREGHGTTITIELPAKQS